MRFKISRQTDVALQAIVLLHENSSPLSGGFIAGEIGVGLAYLSQVLKPLVELGWIGSQTGPEGGYELLVPAKGLTLLAVLEACEGPLQTNSCVLDTRECGIDVPCHFHTMWAKARADFAAALKRTKVVY